MPQKLFVPCCIKSKFRLWRSSSTVHSLLSTNFTGFLQELQVLIEYVTYIRVGQNQDLHLMHGETFGALSCLKNSLANGDAPLVCVRTTATVTVNEKDGSTGNHLPFFCRLYLISTIILSWDFSHDNILKGGKCHWFQLNILKFYRHL